MIKPQEAPVWVKSSRCESTHCVEVADLGPAVGVRNSTVPATSLTFSAADGRGFGAGGRGVVFARLTFGGPTGGCGTHGPFA